MLAVGIHDEGVGEAARTGRLRSGEHGGAFTGVAGKHEHGEARLTREEVG